jgi:hypothetical protein
MRLAPEANPEERKEWQLKGYAYQNKEVDFANKLSLEVNHEFNVDEKYDLLYVPQQLEQVHPTPRLVNRRVYPYCKPEHNDESLGRAREK